jgi:DNA-binding SARP family transcriptional activator
MVQVDRHPGEHDRTAPGRFLHLFGGPFATVGDRRVNPPEGSKRLLALLALHGGPLARPRVARLLWPGVDSRRADGNLRTALWRLHGAGCDLIDSDGQALRLQDGLAVDAQLLHAWALRIISGHIHSGDLALTPWVEDGLCVLPGWYDDWVLVERERLRRSVLEALEVLSRRLHRAGRFAEGVEAALIAVAADPLRDSAQQALIDAHLAEGNLGEAHRARNAYRRLLHRELGVSLPPLMASVKSGRCSAAPAPPAFAR